MHALEREVTDMIRKRRVDPEIGSVLLKLAEQNTQHQYAITEMAKMIEGLTRVLTGQTVVLEHLRGVNDKLRSERIEEKLDEIRTLNDE